MATYNVSTLDFFDESDGLTGTWQSFARLKLTTNASQLQVSVTSSIYGIEPQNALIGLRVNGVMQPSVPYTGTNPLATIQLGSQGVSKTVELWNGGRTGPAGPSYGTSISTVTYPDGSAFTVQTPPTFDPNQITVLGDSITQGQACADALYSAWPNQLRYRYNLPVFIDGYSARSLKYFHELSQPQWDYTSQINRLFTGTPKTLIIALQTNDYGYGDAAHSPATYKTRLIGIIDEARSRFPSIRIIVVNAIVRTYNIVANSYGAYLEDYRIKGREVASEKNVELLEGESFFGTDKLADGLHPNEEGQTIYADRIATLLGSSPSPTPTPTPTASAGADKSVTTSSTTLTATVSSGTVTWSQVSGPNTATIVSPNSLTTSITGLIDGVYVFRITPSNGAAQDTVQVTKTTTVVNNPQTDIILRGVKILIA